MQDRTTFSTRSVSVLASALASFLSISSVAHADQPLELPKKITDLRATPAGDKTVPPELQDFSSLKASIKAEILDDLRGDTKEWRQPAKPKLNLIELAGYFRTRADALNRCDLGTYIPSLNLGTSQCAPPLSYFGSDPASNTQLGGGSWLLSSDLRLRVDPTINVSEDIRIRGRFDLLDNLVLGSTPAYMTGTAAANPTYPYGIFPGAQNSPLLGVNSQFGPFAIKRLWAEVAFPYGEFRFGRVPFHWGLGILFNAGDNITQDYGNNVDGVFFTTRLAGHELTPGFTVSSTGPVGRGGGLGGNGDGNTRWFAAEGGARYDLDPSDNVYNFHLSFARRDCALDIQAMLDDNRVVWNYGALGVYRFQIMDSQYTQLLETTPLAAPVLQPSLRRNLVSRNAHLGTLSLWSKILAGSLLIEAEAVGIFGHIGNGIGLWDNTNTRTDAIWIYQGGVAVESRYGFLQDRLQIGIDLGWASGDPTPGFGVRPGLNKNAQAGDADGQQFGGNDNSITNFSFDRDYKVDLMLFREVLGTVTDALYLKPHVAYYFTENLGLRGDVVASMTNFPSSAPGNSQWLGVELDASAFFKTNDGFIFNLQYGYLFPFAALNHSKAAVVNDTNLRPFFSAQSASALRFMAGIEF
jgi:uncharacterized protein (TIGR04551 family)